jgi:two-component system, cell cycle sensor histidine kinase and response regulator CckA
MAFLLLSVGVGAGAAVVGYVYRRREAALLRDRIVLERQRREENLLHRNALIELSFVPSGGDDLSAVYTRFTEVAANTLNFGRTSIWLHNGDRSVIRCVDLYDRRTGQHSSGYVLARGDAPRYFEALQVLDVISASDACDDPRTSQLAQVSLRPVGVSSMLDVPIHAGGEVIGVVCNEHLGSRREFRPEEETFAVAMATLLSLRLEELQRAQAEAESRLRLAALDAAADGVVITDVAGSIVWVNPAFTAVTGYERSEAIGMTPGELLRSGVHDLAFYEQLWSTIQNGEVWRGEISNRRKDGTVYVEEQSITPIKDDAGNITHFVAIKHDLTERRQLEAKFLQAQKLESVGRLAGGVAHDFNNLLTVINGTADLAAASLRNGDPMRDELRQIRDAGSRAAALTAQLLAFSRGQIMQRGIVSLQSVVHAIVPLLQRLIGEDVQVVTRCGEEPARLFADRAQLEQVLMNLAVNARDAMPAGGTLAIEAAAEGDAVVLSVVDTGAGMSEDLLSHIFEPFFTTKEAHRGTGLGLATVYGIVEQSGGTIEVRSAPGAGTSFTVRFPRTDGVETPTTVDELSASNPGTGTVLVVEDEAIVRHVTCRVLERAGYSVLTAATGMEALALLEGGGSTIDLVLTDVIMPGMGGGELAERMAATWPDTKVLFTSGYSNGSVPGPSMSDDSPHFIGKPYTVEGLTNKVREVLNQT